ncbi:MAG: hypothetical protein FWD71_10705 [Oscillospiraceae bacterium]|nr:hypothetical protein [Oscillospiraceae bacterium]
MEHKYINEMLARADLQQFCEFLISGLELCEIDKLTYSERLNKESKLMEKRIKNISKNEEELDKIFSEFSDATDAYMHVFTEIGMKIGAKLMVQLLCQD